MLKKSLTFLLILICLGLRADYLDDGFAAPPVQARPQTWWHWMNCNITKEGIKADIDAMYKAGVGGFTILDISEGIPEGDVKTASPEWFDMVQYAIEGAAAHVPWTMSIPSTTAAVAKSMSPSAPRWTFSAATVSDIPKSSYLTNPTTCYKVI